MADLCDKGNVNDPPPTSRKASPGLLVPSSDSFPGPTVRCTCAPMSFLSGSPIIEEASP